MKPWERFGGNAEKSSGPVSAVQKSGPWEKFASAKTERPSLADRVSSFAPDKSELDTAAEVLPNAFAFGLGPFAAGVGGGAGGLIGTLKAGGSISDALKAGKEGFLEARDLKNKALKEATDANPKVATLSNVVGALGSAPLGLGKGLIGAMRMGALAGTSNALSNANSLGEGIEDAAGGAAVGALTHGALTGIGAAVEKAGPTVSKYANKAMSKLGGTLTGISPKSIEAYSNKTAKINDLIKKNGGDVANMADNVKQKIVKDIASTKGKLSQQIGDELEKFGDNKTISVQPLLDQLDATKGKLATKIKADPSIGQDFQDMAQKVLNLADESGNVSPKEMHVLKEIFQDEAKGAYMKNGQMFSRGTDAQKAAQQVARVARKSVNEVAPEVAKANNILSELHTIEGNVNRNILKVGGSSSALASAGAGTNPQQAKLLRRIGDITGTNPMEAAEEFASAKDFAHPGLIPVDHTGKSFTRMALGGLLGTKILGPLGVPLGMLGSSPAGLKLAVNARGLLGDYALEPGAKLAASYLRTPMAQEELLNAIKTRASDLPIELQPEDQNLQMPLGGDEKSNDIETKKKKQSDREPSGKKK